MPKTCLLILGMHRSGTSVIAEIFNHLGFKFGLSISPPSFDNPMGFYENYKIQELNDLLLAALGRKWDDPRLLPSDWEEHDDVSAFKEEAKSILEEEFKHHKTIAIKDPRMCLLLPFWTSIFDELGYQLRCLLVYRHPDEIAASLAKRQFFSKEHSYLLITSHLLSAEKYSRKYNRALIKYDNLFINPSSTIHYILKKLSYDSFIKPKNKQNISQFIQPDLRHHHIKKSNEFKNTSPEEVCNSLVLLSKCFDAGTFSQKNEIALDDHYKEYSSLDEEVFENASVDNAFYAKILLDLGTGFNERNSLAQRISDNKVNWQIDLQNFNEPIHQILILPANDKCSLQIRSVLVKSQSTNIVYTLSDNSTNRRDDKLYFQIEHPRIILDFDHPCEIDFVSIEIIYHNIGKSFVKGFSAPKDDLKKSFFDSLFVIIQHPVRLLKNINLRNIRILRSALKRESPRTIIRNFIKLIQRPDIQKVVLKEAAQGQSHVFKDKKDIQPKKSLEYRNTEANLDHSAKIKVLYVAPELPEFDTSSGGRRATRLLALLASECDIYIHSIGRKKTKYINDLENRGLRIVEKENLNAIRKSHPYFHVIIYAWYYTIFEARILQDSYPEAIRIIDSVDVHWVREQRSIGHWHGISERQAKINKSQEIKAYQEADIVWVVSEPDRRAVLTELPNKRTEIVSNIHTIQRTEYIDPGTQNILFFGGFNHHPNISAIKILSDDIFPKVIASVPEAQLLIAGSNAPEEIAKLGNRKGIRFLGFIQEQNLKELYEQSVISVSPLISGAGIKGKITESIAYMTPVITTSIGNEGIELINTKSGLISDDIDELADFIIRSLRREYDLKDIAYNAKKRLVELTSPKKALEVALKSFYRSVEICIVTWNNLGLLKSCLESILQNTSYPTYRISIYSNGCTDGTQEYLTKISNSDKRINPILSDKNEVFVRPNNIMMRTFEEKDIVLLNNDTIVTEGWLISLYSTAYMTPKIGIVGSKILYPDGSLQEYGAELYSDHTGRNIGKWDINPYRTEYARIKAVGYVSGCCMYIKRSTIHTIGVFDDAFHPCYYEDSDYCYSAWENELYTVVSPNSIIYHHEGASAGTENHTGYKKFQTINSNKFWNKHHNHMKNNQGKIRKAQKLIEQLSDNQ